MSLEDKRESELMAPSRHLGKVPVKTRVKSKRDATACLQSYFEDQGCFCVWWWDGGTQMVSFFLLSLHLVCVFIVLLERMEHSKSVSKCPVSPVACGLAGFGAAWMVQFGAVTVWVIVQTLVGRKDSKMWRFPIVNHFKATNRQAFITEFE